MFYDENICKDKNRVAQAQSHYIHNTISIIPTVVDLSAQWEPSWEFDVRKYLIFCDWSEFYRQKSAQFIDAKAKPITCGKKLQEKKIRKF